jgi:murein biosynthesis integral membrane protein MurJ
MWRPARRRDPGSSAAEGAEPGDLPRVETLADTDIPPEALAMPELVVGLESGATLSDDTAKSFGVAGWTLFSRATGLLRVVVAGAILGPTFFANIFQATNTIPNLTYNLMAGSLLTELIIPVLVAELDGRGIEQTRRLLRQIVGVVIAGFSAVALLVVLFSPIIVRLLTFGVHGPGGNSGDARTECWILLFLVLPQIGLYGIVAAAVAAQNARGHFALAAAAPALENIGLISTLVFVSMWFGRDTRHVSTAYLVTLGIGATMAVAVHTAIQCFGAARAGLPLWPSFKWDHPAISTLIKRMIPAAGTASLDASWLFILIVAAGTVPGGVVAIQIGINFYYMPLALSAKSAATVLLPRLSREALHGKWVEFRETYDLGISWSWFVAVPASLTLIVSSRPIAQAIAFGEMRRLNGIALLSAAIAGLGLALVFATMFEFAKQTCYARHDVMAPLIACAAMVAVLLIGAPIAAKVFDGPHVLFALGLLATVGELIRAVVTDRAARKGTHTQGSPRLYALARHVGVALITIGPGAVLGRAIQHALRDHAHIGALVGVVVGVGAGLVAYIVVQALLNAPELPEKLRLSSRRAAVSGGAA